MRKVKLTGLVLMAMTVLMISQVHGADVMPDLIKGETNGVDRTRTYNLGPTGLRGWIYTKPASNLDASQGRTTATSRQILVTHIGTNSPAYGVLQINDVILGVGGQLFSDDARKSFGRAITEAEKTENKGLLKLTCYRANKTEDVQITLRVMGSYTETAPYDCPKSKVILDEACRVLEKEPLNDDLWGAVNGLALMACGKPDYLPKVQAFARSMAAKEVNGKNADSWGCGYKNVFLSEYFLLTDDKAVLPGIASLTVRLARGQGMYGTFGHGFSELTPGGKLHGSVAPYGPVNQAGLIANLGIVLGKKCGVNDPEIDPAIDRAAKFFGYFVGKGGIPYGEHEPGDGHNSNGKDASTALLFALMGNRTEETEFFARMSVAAYPSREHGHTGQGFSYLWSALGANVGGPEAVAAFLKENDWHLDLVRRCDGSFTYDGAEQYGAGRTEDNTYYGKSSYNGLSPNACYVLTYSIPLKKLYITGKASRKEDWLSSKEVSQAIASGRFDSDRKNMNISQLMAAMDDWSPVVRMWAAQELAGRPEATNEVPSLIKMAEGENANMRQGACESLGYMKSTEALPVFVRLLKHEDRWLRFKAADALGNMGDAALPVLSDMLQALVDTAEPLSPIVWEDPVQLAHGHLAQAVFGRLIRDDRVKEVDRNLLYPAIQAVSRNADGRARGRVRNAIERLDATDVKGLAPDLLAALRVRAPADTMFGNEIRMTALKTLVKYKYSEGIDGCVHFAKTQGGHGSQNRTGEIMDLLVPYGKAAQKVIPDLKALIVSFNDEVANKKFPGGALNEQRVTAVEEAIKAIESATTQPEIINIVE